MLNELVQWFCEVVNGEPCNDVATDSVTKKAFYSKCVQCYGYEFGPH